MAGSRVVPAGRRRSGEAELHVAIKRLQPWSRPREAVRQVLCGATLRTCAPVALVVGTVLSALNQGDVLVKGMGDGLVVLKLAANFVIPYVTSSTRALLTVRRPVERHVESTAETAVCRQRPQPSCGKGCAPITSRSPSGSSTTVTP